MARLIFPQLIGMDIKISKSPQFNTKIQTSVNGKEKRASLTAYPSFQFKAAVEVLFAEAALNDYAEIMSFFLKARGAFSDWLFTDPDDHSFQNQLIGIGDGVQTMFQLVNNIGGFVFPILDPKPGLVVKVDNVLSTNYTITDDGIIAFHTAPSAGSDIKVTGEFYYRCRFMKDEIEFERFADKLYSLKSFEFKSVK